MSTIGVQRLARVSRTVSDLDRAVAFYRDALDFSVIDETTWDDAAWGDLMGIADARGRCAMLQLGEQELELVAFDPPGNPYPLDSDSSDLWFQHIAVVVSDMHAAYTRLCGYAFTPVTEGGPQRLPASSGGVTAYKFRDPDGHPLELIEFPVGTGDPMWQTESDVFLGIDHSAIDVADVEISIDFYARLLGFSVASRSFNSGPAQQRLDRAFKDRVDVVALQPATPGPPHIELLGYKKPAGHSIPKHARSNDIAADRLVLQVDDLPRLVQALRAENAEFVSRSVDVSAADSCAALVRDPTGHLLMLCAR